MTRPQYYKFLFRACSIWSWTVSVAYFIGETLGDPLLHTLLPPARPKMLLDLAVMPTFLFGFAFWALSNDLTKNRAIAGVGAAGSILAFVSFLSRASTGDVSFMMMPASTIDLTFGLLMSEFMLRTRPRPKAFAQSA